MEFTEGFRVPGPRWKFASWSTDSDIAEKAPVSVLNSETVTPEEGISGYLEASSDFRHHTGVGTPYQQSRPDSVSFFIGVVRGILLHGC